MIHSHKKRSPLYWFRVVFDTTFLLVSLSLQVAAQYQFDLFTTEHGLPQNSVNAVLQTRDGYLWLATNDGLARFDGVRFTIFNQGNTKGLGSNRIMSLYEDRQGRLWIGTYEGLLVRYRDGEFFTFTPQHGLPYDPINWIEEDAQGRLWLTGERGVTRWEEERGFAFDLTSSLPGLKRNKWEQCKVWWSTDKTGLHIFSGGRVQSYTEQDGLPSLNIISVHPDRRGNVWLGTADAGLVKLKDGQLTNHKKGWPGEKTGGLAYEDQTRNLWLFEISDGLLGNILMQVNDGQLTRYPAVISFGGSFYEDREGTFWIGTHKGLYHARPMAIRTLTDKALLRDHFNLNELFYSVLADRTGTVWLGKWGGGVARYRDGRFRHHVGGEDWKATLSASKKLRELSIVFEKGLFSARVTSLYEDRAGVIWIGTDGGVSRCKDGQFTRFSDQHGLANTWAMHEDHAGNFWFGTATGLTRLSNSGRGEFTVYTTRDGLAHNDVKAILEDRQGALWIGTHGGLSRYAEGRFTTFNEFGEHQVRTLYEDADGVLWIGTYGSGLFRFQAGKFTRYTTREGLFNDGVFQILEDARSYFWISCNIGIYRVRRQELNEMAAGKLKQVIAIPYDKKDGLLNIECNGGRQPAGWKMRDGKLWFPTMLGVAIVDPEAVPANTVPLPVVIEEFLLDQQPQAFRAGVRLEPGQHRFEIRYTGLSFIKPEQVRFKYRLEGWDRDWIEVGTRRTAYYSNVAPGQYLFKVMAANSDGVWNEQAAVLWIVMQPHWWQTWWFKVGGWLSLLGVIAGLYLRRHAQVKRKQAAQEKVARQLIEAHESERKRIASELHDSLNQTLLIINNEALLGEVAARDHEASQAKFSAITEAASQAITEVHEIIYSLRPFQLDRFGLYRALLTLLEKVETSSGVRFVPELADLKGVLTPDEETQVYRIVQEGINNIIKHAKATEARLTLVREGQHIFLTLADNGRGFVLDAATEQPAKSRGLGLIGIRERVRILGGKVEIQTAPGAGTTITIHFPLTHRGSSP